jgi:hypothetical protein
MSMSGWWPATSAAAATSLTNTIAPGEVGTHEGLDELVAPTLPTGQALQALGDRGVIQPWHGSSFPENERCDLRPPYGN